MKVKKIKRKTFKIDHLESTDFISPSFGYGCLYNCSYCYMKRHSHTGLSVATNTEDILTEINSHAAFAQVDKPNQTHKEYITYDISCNEGFCIYMLSIMNGKKIFTFFKDHPDIWEVLLQNM